jgi:hypothetical protein
MKIWFGICGLLSAGLLALMLTVMESCISTYEVGAGGELLRTSDEPGTSPPRVRRQPISWDQLTDFEFVRSHVRPGDELRLTEKMTGIPYTKVAWMMSTLEVFRGTTRWAVYREGQLRFWGFTALTAAAPLILWSIAALIMAACSPRKARPPPG